MSIASVVPAKLSQGYHHRIRFLGASGRVDMAACFFWRHGSNAGPDVQTYPFWAIENFPDDYGCYGLSYILDGHGVVVDQLGRRFPVSAGCVLQFSMKSFQDKSLRLEPTDNLLECGIHFNGGLGHYLDRARIWNPNLQYVENVFDTSIVERYVRFYDLMSNQALSSGAIMRDAVAMIDMIYTRFEAKPESDGLIVRACQLLSEHPEPEYTSKKVAAELHLSYGAFRRKFTRQIGIPPNTYQLQQKINLACGLLGRFTVKEVSFKLGYKNESAFSKQFKKLVGLPPSVFRRRN